MNLAKEIEKAEATIWQRRLERYIKENITRMANFPIFNAEKYVENQKKADEFIKRDNK